MRVPERDLAELARASWALALCVEVFRAGLLPGSPLDPLTKEFLNPTPDQLRALASEAAVQELVELLELAQERLLVPLSGQPAPWFAGPTFSLSRQLAGDADFIAGPVLLESKTSLGDKLKDGTRVTGLEVETLRQMIAYVLHDDIDEFGLTEIALYRGRFGYLTVLNINELLTQASGRQVDLVAERARWSEVVRSA